LEALLRPIQIDADTNHTAVNTSIIILTFSNDSLPAKKRAGSTTINTKDNNAIARAYIHILNILPKPQVESFFDTQH
jgi:hypothetical protein